jgi:outer membrane protein, heavy metal efflux system
MICVFGILLLAGSAAAQALSSQEGAPLSLPEAIERVHSHSPARGAAQAREQAAAGALFQATRLPNPSLDLRQENLNLNSGRHAPVDQTVDVFAVFSQPLETGGKRATRTAIATADVEIARAILRDTERKLTLETLRFYLAALRASRVGRVLADNRRDLQTLVDTMIRRVQEGYAAEADLLKFRTEVARLETELTRVHLEFTRNVVALSALLLMPESLSEAQLVEYAPLDPPTGRIEELAQTAVNQQPTILIARARLERARRAVELERARRLPDVAFALGYKRTAGEDTVVTGFIVPLPIYDQNRGNIERTLAEERATALELETVTRQLTAETIALLTTAQQLVERARDSDTALLQPAEIVRNAARSAFREGAANILQLIDAERVYTDARRTVLDLKFDAYAAAFEARLVVDGKERP